MGAAVSMEALAAASIGGMGCGFHGGLLAVFAAVAFIPRAGFAVEAFSSSVPCRAGDVVTAYAVSILVPAAPTQAATLSTAIVAGPAFRAASSQPAAPSRTA